MLRREHIPSRLLLCGVLTLLLGVLPTSGAQAQDDQEDDNDSRRERFNIPDGATSLDNRNLERILERFPESDADGDGVLTADEGRTYIEQRTEEWEESRRNRNNNNRRRRGPTHRDVAYGDDARHRIDLYLAPTDEDNPGPTPLVVYFHGGQFVTGDKGNVEINSRELLDAGISVASVEYRLTRDEPFPACFEDAARAIQFLRLNAAEYNLDPEQFATAGTDAGANLALFVAMHDDLAERPNARERERRADRNVEFDPYDEVGIMMQSTRVMGVMAVNPLASFDPRFWDDNDLPLNNHERYLPAWLGVNFLEPFNDKELIDLVEALSPAELASTDDPPTLLLSLFEDLEINEETSWTIMRLHPQQCRLLDEALRGHGVRTILRYRGMSNDPGTGSADFFPELFGVNP